MSIGDNLQYLRKQKKLTQEGLAERMGVSRQTVSRWKADEVTPELDRLEALCSLFGCTLDGLVRSDLRGSADIYSAVSIRRVPAFRMARYVMITPNPEDDVNRYMDLWAKESGLLQKHPKAKRIGWDFPFVSVEQVNRFHLRGYAAAYVLPEDFETNLPGVEYANNAEADYAVITVREPFRAAFDRIPNGYRRIMEYLGENGYREKTSDDIQPCFECVYVTNGVEYMDIYMHASRG